jgi:hypothetical protein
MLNEFNLNTDEGIEWLRECCAEGKKEIKVLEIGKFASHLITIIALVVALFGKSVESYETAYAVSIVIAIVFLVAICVCSFFKGAFEAPLNWNVNKYKQLYSDLGYLKTQLPQE